MSREEIKAVSLQNNFDLFERGWVGGLATDVDVVRPNQDTPVANDDCLLE